MMNGDKRGPLHAAHCIFFCKIAYACFPRVIFPRDCSSECVNNVNVIIGFAVRSDSILFNILYRFFNIQSTHFRMFEFLSINKRTSVNFHFIYNP